MSDAPRREREGLVITYGIVPERQPTFAAALEGGLFHSWSCWRRYSRCCRAKERRTRARAEKRSRRRRTRTPDRGAEPCRAGHCWRCSCERFLSSGDKPMWSISTRRHEVSDPDFSLSLCATLSVRASRANRKQRTSRICPLLFSPISLSASAVSHSTRSFPPLAPPREATLTSRSPVDSLTEQSWGQNGLGATLADLYRRKLSVVPTIEAASHSLLPTR